MGLSPKETQSSDNLTDFEILGLWPVVIGVSASVANLIWDTARKDDDYEDGASI